MAIMLEDRIVFKYCLRYLERECVGCDGNNADCPLFGNVLYL